MNCPPGPIPPITGGIITLDSDEDDVDPLNIGDNEEPLVTEGDAELADDPLGMDTEEVECSNDVGTEGEEVECSPDIVQEDQGALKISEVSSLAEEKVAEPHESETEHGETSPTPDDTTKESEDETCPVKTGSKPKEKQSEIEAADDDAAPARILDPDVSFESDEDEGPTPDENGAQPGEPEIEASEEQLEKSSTADNTTKETEEETVPQDTGSDTIEKQSENEVMDTSMGEEEEAGKSTDDVALATDEDEAPTSSEKGAQPQEPEMEVGEEPLEKSPTPVYATKVSTEEICPQYTGSDFTGKQSENKVMVANMDGQEEADRSTEDATRGASDDAGVSLMDTPSPFDL